MTVSNLRYQLLPYKGPNTRLDCPSCGKKHQLTPYYDTRTDEVLPGEYGHCNRVANCGYHVSPYHKDPSGMSYAEATYQQWREDQQYTSMTSPRTYIHSPVAPLNRPHAAVEQPIYSLPVEVFNQSLAHYERNQFAVLLQTHFGSAVASELLDRFQLGTSSHWPGACVFWLIDQLQRVRGGQVVLFDSAGHTAKRTLPNGVEKRCTSWVHYALATRYNQRQQAWPDWLTTYIDKADKFPIPFGLHQLSSIKQDQAVAIVESPKTAVVCSPYFPQFVWMAIGGLTYLNSDERLKPLQPYKLVLFPDASVGGKAFERWNSRAEQLRNQGYSITVSDYLEQRASDDEKVKGYDLADYLLDQWKGYPPDWDDLVHSNNPSEDI